MMLFMLTLLPPGLWMTILTYFMAVPIRRPILTTLLQAQPDLGQLVAVPLTDLPCSGT